MRSRISCLGLLLGTVCGISRPAAAHSIADELSVNRAQSSASNARQGAISNRLLTDWEVTEALTLHGDLTLVRESPVAAPEGSSFGTSASLIAALAAGADLLLGDTVDVGLDVHGSPWSTVTTGTVVPYTDLRGRVSAADAQLRSQTRSIGGTATGFAHFGGLSDHETTVDGSVGLDDFEIIQSITALEVRGQPVSATRITALCDRAPSTPGCKQATAALGNHPDALLQARFTLGVTETLHDDTDVGLRGAYYVYNQDPTTVGYFSVATAGRDEDPALGQGTPIAPLRYTVRPSVEHRFGRLSVNLAYEYGHYVAEEGDSHAVALKVAYKLSKHFKLWLAGEGRGDFDGLGDLLLQVTVAVGARYRF